MDIVFDITMSHARMMGGHADAQRITITGADVVTLKDKVINELLLPAILMQHQNASFNPKELCSNDTNFSLLLVIEMSRLKLSTNTCTLSTCIMCSWLCKWVVISNAMLLQHCNIKLMWQLKIQSMMPTKILFQSWRITCRKLLDCGSMR